MCRGWKQHLPWDELGYACDSQLYNQANENHWRSAMSVQLTNHEMEAIGAKLIVRQ